MPVSQPVLIFLATEDWYFVSHRLPLARAAVAAGYRVIVATRVTNDGRLLAQAGCEVVQVEWTRGTGSPLSEFRLLVRLVALYRSRRPAVVHHVALKPVLYGSLAALMAKVPAVVNAIAGLGYLFINADRRARLLRPIVAMAFRKLLNRRGTWVILQNPADQALLASEVGLEAERTVLIRGAGVDVAEFRDTPLPAGEPIVILPARLLWDKGVGEFVEAARQLRDEGLVARFALVGGLDPANPRAVERQLVETWVAEGSVEWWGHRSDMPNVYRKASIVCLPSYREGLPKALLEAAASGRPIVTTDVPGCREIVAPDDNGLLVEPRNPSALAAALRSLLQDRDACARMGQRGRLRAESEFSVERVVAETLPLYLRPAP